ncbi:MAG: hypothetical protein ACT4NX_03475 [Deltaproteobacteria bacterium]
MMRIIFMLLVCLILAYPAYSDENTPRSSSSPLGLKLGTSRKQALGFIESRGNKIIENTKDSKNVRTVFIEGALVELPLDTANAALSTRLEFYDEKLMSSSLILKSDGPSKHKSLEGELAKFLGELYGDAGDTETVLGIRSLTWYVPKVRIVFSANPSNNTAKVQYIYEPVNQAKRSKEFEQKQDGPAPDPAKQMFLDGDYSQSSPASRPQ